MADAVSDPVETHDHGARAALLGSGIEDSCCGAVFVFYLSGWLGMARLFKGDAYGHTILGVDEECFHFGFFCRSEEDFHDASFSVDGEVVGWLLGRWLGWIVRLGAQE